MHKHTCCLSTNPALNAHNSGHILHSLKQPGTSWAAHCCCAAAAEGVLLPQQCCCSMQPGPVRWADLRTHTTLTQTTPYLQRTCIVQANTVRAHKRRTVKPAVIPVPASRTLHRRQPAAACMLRFSCLLGSSRCCCLAAAAPAAAVSHASTHSSSSSSRLTAAAAAAAWFAAALLLHFCLCCCLLPLLAA